MINNYEINKEYIDEFGRVSGVFTHYKPAGVLSHDIVDDYRKKYNTRDVGHAGALDPFAEGLMIILVGKATKLSDQFLGMDKEYIATLVLGVATESGDIDGKITEMSNKNDFPKEIIQETLNSFYPGYAQFVPVFSSVKVKGEKLRKVARKYQSFDIAEIDGKQIARFYNDSILKKEIVLPKRDVKINEIELLSISNISASELSSLLKVELAEHSFQTVKFRVSVSKGTYIRQLAVDIGKRLWFPATLIKLVRTRAGEITI